MASRQWTEAEIKRLLHYYPYMQTQQLARVLGRPLSSCYRQAALRGVRKSPEFFDRPHLSGRTDGKKGISGRFKKGHVPFNAGKKGHCAAGCEKTWFRSGNKPQSWVTVGTEVTTDDGYLKRKISDDRTKPSRYNWKLVHVIVWEQHNGPLPKGHIVVFRNGNRRDIHIKNLEMITLAENMKRNTLHNLPPELKKVIHMKGALNRTITRLEKHEREQRTGAA